MSTEGKTELRVQVLDHEGDMLFEAVVGVYRRGFVPLPTGFELVQLLATFAGQGAQVARALVDGAVWREVHRG